MVGGGRKRTAVLISGRGSNLARLVEAAADRDFPAEIAAVLSDTLGAAGLQFAASKKIAATALPRADFAGRAEHEAAVESELTRQGVELVCLAGYMRLLSPEFVARWQGRLLNIHPSLLPCFPGLDTHRKALESGVRVHGCTVHFVSERVDAGPIIAQAAVPLLVGDTEETLAARVLKAEHQLFPLALDLVARGNARLEGGRTVFSGFDESGRVGLGRLFSPSPFGGEVDLEALARVTP